MFGNIDYILYSILLFLALAMLLGIFVWRLGKRVLRWLLPVCLLPFILFQLYFWNQDINFAVKSYLFANRSYQCDNNEELQGFSLSLPNRTVLKGKEDACSPFYLTYASKAQFKAHFQTELERLQKTGEIQNFKYVGVDETYDIITSRFEVELPEGSILIIKSRNLDKLLLFAIDYQPT